MMRLFVGSFENLCEYFAGIFLAAIVIIVAFAFARGCMGWKRFTVSAATHNVGFGQSLAKTPFGYQLIFLPHGTPVGLFSERLPGEICWSNKDFQALKRQQGNATYFLIMGRNMPSILALMKINASERLCWIYANGVPEKADQEAFEDLVGLSTVLHHRPKLDTI